MEWSCPILSFECGVHGWSAIAIAIGNGTQASRSQSRLGRAVKAATQRAQQNPVGDVSWIWADFETWKPEAHDRESDKQND